MGPDQPPQPPGALSSASRYWDTVLDPQNLERNPGAGHSRAAITEEIEFAKTPDLEVSRRWMQAAASAPVWIIDLGAGLGANSFALAAMGHRVIAVDTSISRLRALKERARAVGLDGRIDTVVAAAEAMPFLTGSVPALYTKSVLIHTDMPKVAEEITRILTPGGRAALDEPLTGNPFVRLYRGLLAPKAWRSITRYFDPEAQAIFIKAPGLRVPADPIHPLYFFSFFAFIFQFGWPRLRLFKWALAILHPIDHALFRLLPPLRRWAWFGVIKLEKKK